MTFHFSITPDPSTHARLVRQDVPSLVLYDGSATVWLSPGERPQAAWEAARVAAMLARAADAFGRECQHLAGSPAATERRPARPRPAGPTVPSRAGRREGPGISRRRHHQHCHHAGRRYPPGVGSPLSVRANPEGCRAPRPIG